MDRIGLSLSVGVVGLRCVGFVATMPEPGILDLGDGIEGDSCEDGTPAVLSFSSMGDSAAVCVAHFIALATYGDRGPRRETGDHLSCLLFDISGVVWDFCFFFYQAFTVTHTTLVFLSIIPSSLLCTAGQELSLSGVLICFNTLALFTPAFFFSGWEVGKLGEDGWMRSFGLFGGVRLLSSNHS